MIDQELRQEVIDLNNGLFEWKISDDEVDVPAAVMSGITGLYADCDGSPFYAARFAEDCVNNMQDENVKLVERSLTAAKEKSSLKNWMTSKISK